MKLITDNPKTATSGVLFRQYDSVKPRSNESILLISSAEWSNKSRQM